MQKKEAVCDYTLVIHPVIEETRDHSGASTLRPSRYQIAEDLVKTHQEYRRAIDEEVPEVIVGEDNRAHDNYPVSGVNGRRTCHITATVGSQTFMGSGAFIAPRLVLTAAHVVRPTGTVPDSIRVIPAAYRRGNENGDVIFPFGEQSTSESRIHSRYVHSDAHRSQYDIGVVVLPDDTLYRRVGERWGIIAPTNELLNKYRRGSRESYTINPFGYPGDKPVYSMWTTSLSYITSYDALTMETDADIVPGQSGSAVIHSWGGYWVMGVVVAERPSINVIKRIDDGTFRELQAWMDEFR